MKNNKLKIIVVAILWLITLVVPFVMYNIPHENQNGGLVSEYAVEYKGSVYRFSEMHSDFFEFETKEKIWLSGMKNFWLVENENGEEFIYVTKYGENFLCTKTAESPKPITPRIIAATIASAVFSFVVTVISAKQKNNKKHP